MTMVRRHGQVTICPNCRQVITNESAIGRWFRKQSDQLPSVNDVDGYFISDLDFIVHRFKLDKSRNKQRLMTIEVKCGGAEVSASQLDTLQALHGTMITKGLVKVNGRIVINCGVHILRLSGNDPDDSSEMWWNGEPIDKQTLLLLLRMDNDPRQVGDQLPQGIIDT